MMAQRSRSAADRSGRGAPGQAAGRAAPSGRSAGEAWRGVGPAESCPARCDSPRPRRAGGRAATTGGATTFSRSPGDRAHQAAAASATPGLGPTRGGRVNQWGEGIGAARVREGRAIGGRIHARQTTPCAAARQHKALHAHVTVGNRCAATPRRGHTSTTPQPRGPATVRGW